jgi:putative endonuclease
MLASFCLFETVMPQPTNTKKPFGQYGENLAVKHLQQGGYQIVGRNWRCSLGEIDIIARHGTTLVFVEVRSRHTANTEAAFESITPTKRSRMIALAHAWLADHDAEDEDWRVDVVAIAQPRGGHPIIEHVEDALGW